MLLMLLIAVVGGAVAGYHLHDKISAIISQVKAKL